MLWILKGKQALSHLYLLLTPQLFLSLSLSHFLTLLYKSLWPKMRVKLSVLSGFQVWKKLTTHLAICFAHFASLSFSISFLSQILSFSHLVSPDSYYIQGLRRREKTTERKEGPITLCKVKVTFSFSPFYSLLFSFFLSLVFVVSLL